MSATYEMYKARLVQANHYIGGNITNKTLYGVNTFEPPYGATAHTANIAACNTIGAKVIRCGLTWSNTQTTSDPASINWAEWDSIYNKCLAANITPMFAIETTPAWANPSFGAPSIFAVPTYPSADFNSWVTLQAAWAAQVVTRYPLALFEWWNEWSSASGYWKEGDSGSAKPTIAAYAQAYMACYSAMKAAVPTCTVAVGGMTAVTYWSGPLATTAVNVVPLLLAIPGFVTDAWSIHPYCHDFTNPTPVVDHFPTSNSFTDIARFQATMVANGEGRKPLWVTEWGDYSAATVGSEAIKASYVTASLRLIRNNYGIGKVGAGNAGVSIACIYPLQNAPSGAIQDSGLYAGTTSGVTTQLAAGAAFQSFTQANGTYVAPTFPPILISATPATLGQGATSQNIALVGTGFTNGDTAVFSNAGITVNSTTFNSSTSLTANITVSGGASATAGTVLVNNATNGNSNTQVFTVTSSVPVNPDTVGLVLQMLGTAGTSTTTNGAGVASWTDQSATAAVFSQATGGTQPTYVTSGINSLPSLAFSGAQYLNAAATISALNVTNFKFFAVIKVTGSAGTDRDIFSNRNTAGTKGWEVMADHNDSWRVDYGTGSGNTETDGGTVNSTAHVITVIYDQTQIAKQVIRIDGTQVASAGDAYSSATTIAPAIGCSSDSVGSEKFNGQMSELLFYDTSIHNPTTATIEAYLKSKYNTP